MDILLTNPFGRTGELVAESLRADGHKVDIMEGPNAHKHEGAYMKALRTRMLEQLADMIIPVFFPEVLAAHREEFPLTLMPIDKLETLTLLDDKLSCCRLAGSLGIPQPEMYSGADEVKSFPVVFKRPRGHGGDSVYFPGNSKALANILKPAKDYILSEYIDGEDWCTDVLRWDGFFYAASYRVLEPKRKGVSTLRESVIAPQLAEYARTILDAVDYQGVCGLDFRRRSSDGKFFFLECNPRFSGGLASALASGFDIPALLCRMASGESVNPSLIQFTPNIITS